jgi:hypothetical protein
MDAVGGDNHIGFGNRAIRKRDPRHIIALFKACASMAGVDHIVRQCVREKFNKIGAVHSERCIPA